MKYAEIVFNIPLNQVYHYIIPEQMKDKLRPGHRVIAPFGNRLIEGYCVGLTDIADFEKLKELRGFDDETKLFSEELLKLGKWIADYYVCGWGEALEAMLPSGVRKGNVAQKVRYASLKLSKDEALRHASKIIKRASKRAKALKVLAESKIIETSELSSIHNISSSVLKALENMGWIEIFYREKGYAKAVENIGIADSPHTLTDEQHKVYENIKKDIDDKKFNVHVLKGVTGSGKTEVYLRLIADAIKQGKQALILVPEIALTPQTIEIFRSRFTRIAVLHSHQTPAQRREEWIRVFKGEVEVVIGARSGVFAPVPNLGIVVIDEEHENSFKQESPAPRYHAREVAIMRASWDKAVVVLGSATPSVETYWNARLGKFKMQTLSNRVASRPLPPVKIIDMKKEISDVRKKTLFSRALLAAGKECLERGEQMIVFLNRRGYSTVVHCPNCELTLKCKHCDISLTYHRSTSTMICHHCDYRAKVPSRCPDCGSTSIKYFGFGTEQVEEQLQAAFPGVTYARMDSDTTAKRGTHSKILSAFKRGELQILLGTQMIAKGLDFPNVTVVGIISADTILNMPDFRSAERTFQLVTQVSGRTGRGTKGGTVIVQTYSPDQPAIIFASKHDYDRFVKHELASRKNLDYPPFKRMTRIIFSGPEESVVKQHAHNIGNKLREIANNKIDILGPIPAPIAQIRNDFRYHVIMKFEQPNDSLIFFKKGRELLKKSGKVKITVDIDAVSML